MTLFRYPQTHFDLAPTLTPQPPFPGAPGEDISPRNFQQD